MDSITGLQKENMEHALGLNYKKLPFRNYYCVYSRNASWEELIKKGLACVSIQRTKEQTYYYYHVTDKGIELLGFKTDCAELGCQNKFYKDLAVDEKQTKSYCKKHYNLYK